MPYTKMIIKDDNLHNRRRRRRRRRTIECEYLWVTSTLLALDIKEVIINIKSIIEALDDSNFIFCSGKFSGAVYNYKPDIAVEIFDNGKCNILFSNADKSSVCTNTLVNEFVSHISGHMVFVVVDD